MNGKYKQFLKETAKEAAEMNLFDHGSGYPMVIGTIRGMVAETEAPGRKVEKIQFFLEEFEKAREELEKMCCKEKSREG